MKEIKTSSGASILVSDEDFAALSKRTWHLTGPGPLYYAACNNGKENGKHKMLRMHRVIAGAVTGQQVDHIDGNTLNNQRDNLRIVTNAENGRAKCVKARTRECTSIYRGVSWHPQSGKWRARVFFNYRQNCAGLYSSQEEAALAYNKRAAELGFLPEALNKVEAA